MILATIIYIQTKLPSNDTQGVLYINAVRQAMCSGWHLVACGKHLHACIILLREEV
jgi:hypothetical protein